jgi:glycosyltransferase involved in cell wall biosynthesis
MSKVSVITPAHITTEQKMVWLKEAIQSVLDQSEPDWEMVIVNNCSTDDQRILDILKPVWGDNRIKAYKYEHEANVCVARNLAAHHATSKLILPLDADDRLRRDAIKLFLDTWEMGGKDQGIVYSDVLMFDDNTHRYIKAPEYNFKTLLRKLIMPVGCLHRKSDWERCGGWLDDMKTGLEDWEYWIRLGAKGVCGYHVNADLYHYRRHIHSRYTALRQNDSKSYDLAYTKMRELHKDLYNGRFPMGCCPGGGVAPGPQRGVQQQRVPVASLQNPVRVMYNGKRKGSFYVTGRATGIKYLVPGRDRLLISSFGQVGVDERDVNHILSLNIGRDFKREVRK